MDPHHTPVTRDDVVIERVEAAGEPDDRWRIRSADCADAIVDGKPAAIDAALARIEGKRGNLYIRDGEDGEATPFNPAGA